MWAKHKASSWSGRIDTMTKKFLNNYSFVAQDTIDGAYVVNNSKIKTSQVIQPKNIKEDLNAIIEEHRNKELLKNFWLIPNNKLIFNWPSGCWKTLFALAMANALKKKLYIVNLSSIISSGLGKTWNNIFDIIEKCNKDNWIIFFDEFDALAKIRNDDKDHWEIKRIASSLIQILDYINDSLIFIAATNHIELIDWAILRRFSKQINFEMPNGTHIKKFIWETIKELNMNIDKETTVELSKLYKWKSYAEIKEDLVTRIKKFIIQKSKKWDDNFTLDSNILK